MEEFEEDKTRFSKLGRSKLFERCTEGRDGGRTVCGVICFVLLKNERYRVQRLLSFVLRTFSLFPPVSVQFYQLELERTLDRCGHPKHRSQ